MSDDLSLREKVLKLEGTVLGTLVHYKQFSTQAGREVAQAALSTIHRKMRDLGLADLPESKPEAEREQPPIDIEARCPHIWSVLDAMHKGTVRVKSYGARLTCEHCMVAVDLLYPSPPPDDGEHVIASMHWESFLQPLGKDAADKEQGVIDDESK